MAILKVFDQTLDDETADVYARLFHALADGTRLAILLVWRHRVGGPQRPVGQPEDGDLSALHRVGTPLARQRITCRR